MGSYKYTVSIPRTGASGGGGDTTPPVESYDLSQKIKAALAAGAFKGLKLAVALAVIAGIILILAAAVGSLPPLAWIIAIGIVILVISAVRGLWEASERGYDWAVKAAARAWEVDDKARARAEAIEDAQLKAQRDAVAAAREQVRQRPDTDGNPLTLTDEQRLDLVAIWMLERAYLGKGSPTRDAMCGDGVCIQMEWNLVNAGMKAIGVREKKSWSPLGFQQAWELWRDNVRIATDAEGVRYLEVLKQNGKWHAIERIE